MTTVPESLTVVVADDHARLRGRIRHALEAGGCSVRGEAATAEQAVRLAERHRPRVALLDIHMPGNGITAARQITATLPETSVVMLTQSQDDEDLFESLRAGATGYLLKDIDPSVLPRALRGVLRGEAAMPPSLMSRVLREFRTTGAARPRRSAAASRLTDREVQVMELLSSGLSTEQVAGQLSVSPTTVRVHVSAVLRKLRVRDRASAFKLLRGQ